MVGSSSPSTWSSLRRSLLLGGFLALVAAALAAANVYVEHENGNENENADVVGNNGIGHQRDEGGGEEARDGEYQRGENAGIDKVQRGEDNNDYNNNNNNNNNNHGEEVAANDDVANDDEKRGNDPEQKDGAGENENEKAPPPENENAPPPPAAENDGDDPENPREKIPEETYEIDPETGFRITGESIGRIVMGLFGDEVPLTVKSFVEFANNKRGASGEEGYTGRLFHRIIDGFMIQGGGYDAKTGAAMRGVPFKDENFKIKHFTGCLSMANAGPNTNGSQFFITTAVTSWLDGKHVVFGKVLFTTPSSANSEESDVVKAISKTPVDKEKGHKPIADVVITSSGTWRDPEGGAIQPAGGI